jgi:Mg2+-importing ATPase
MRDLALINQVAEVNLFAEIEPNQKERIKLALKKAGFVVGYMGDGINDVSALHAAEVGISVDSAADVAKETSQIVLLEKIGCVGTRRKRGARGADDFCQYVKICLYGYQF